MIPLSWTLDHAGPRAMTRRQLDQSNCAELQTVPSSAFATVAWT